MRRMFCSCPQQTTAHQQGQHIEPTCFVYVASSFLVGVAGRLGRVGSSQDQVQRIQLLFESMFFLKILCLGSRTFGIRSARRSRTNLKMRLVNSSSKNMKWKFGNMGSKSIEKHEMEIGNMGSISNQTHAMEML